MKVIKRLSINAPGHMKGWGKDGAFNVDHATLNEFEDGSVSLEILSANDRVGSIQLAGSKKELLKMIHDIKINLTQF